MKVSEAQPLYLELQRRGAIPCRQQNPSLPADVAALIDQCLEYDLEKRPASAAELARALRRERKPRRRLGRAWLAVAAGLFLVVAAMGATLWAQQNASQADHWERGQQAYRDADYLTAVEHFSPILKSEPLRYDALVARARAYIKLGVGGDKKYLALASTDLLRACADPNDDGEAWAGYGYCLTQMGQSEEEVTNAFRKAIEKGFDTAETNNNYACCLIQSSDLQKADKHIKAALRHNPQFTAALYNRAMRKYRLVVSNLSENNANPKAMLKRNLDLIRQAKEDLLNVSRVGPESPILHRDMADLWAMSVIFTPEDIDDAFKYLQKAVETGGWNASRLIQNTAIFRGMMHDPRFQQLTAMPAIQLPNQPSMRIVNPMRD